MKKTALIVEDDERNRRLFRDLLRFRGFEVLEAGNGKEGVDAARAKRPDLILMDIQMPVMDGLEAIGILKADPGTRGIPVLAVTSYAMKDEEERIRAAGCDGYISKPVDTREFLEKVSRYL